jgi:hypothetical protein
MADLLAQLKGVGRSGDGWTARCPAHDDRHNSLSIHYRDGRWLLRCHAGCGWQEIVDTLGLDAADLFDGEQGRRGRLIPSDNCATAQPATEPLPEGLPPLPSGQQGLTWISMRAQNACRSTFSRHAGYRSSPMNASLRFASRILERMVDR